MQKSRTFSQKTNLFLKGLAMGSANKVPGVSGGMIAFVLGFYEELINTFKQINARAFRLLFRGEFKGFAKYTNIQFLFFVMLGSMCSYFSVSLILDYFLKNYELYVWSCFFGMIIGSIYYIFKGFKAWGVSTIISLLFGVVIGVSISFLEPARENDNLWFVFLCGIIGVSGMTLPGLSGSFILILLGNYVLLLVDSVNVFGSVLLSVFSGNFEVFSDPLKTHYLKIIGVFTLGSAFGLVTISHVLGYVLKHYRNIVTAVIMGFIAGSLGNVWPWKKTIFKTESSRYILDAKGNKVVENYERFIPEFSDSKTWLALVFVILGVSLILIIDHFGKKRR